jgi:hypothetical protein
MGKNKQEEELFYVHSKCCKAHWELTYNATTNQYCLVCEKCEMPIGNAIEVIGPVVEDAKCECCDCGECDEEEHTQQ